MGHWSKGEVDFLVGHPEMTAIRVAESLGRSRKSVLQKKARMRGPFGPYKRPGAPSGEKHPSAILTEDLVRAMRKRRAEGVSYLDLSIEFNMSVNTTWKAVTGRTWKCVK